MHARDGRRPRVRRRPPARRTRALHRRLVGWIRGRRLGRAPRGLRAREALPGVAQHPRWAVRAVRNRFLRRVPGLLRRRLRRPVLEPSRRVRLLRGARTGDPLWENVQAYLEKSPSTYGQAMETPVLVLHSEQDLRCAIEQGEHLFTLLRLLGKDVELVRFPAESHELSRAGSPLHRVQRFETILEYFGRYLAPGA